MACCMAQAHILGVGSFKSGGSFGLPYSPFLKIKRMNIREKFAPLVLSPLKSSGTSSALSSSSLIDVIGSGYCEEYPINITMVRKVITMVIHGDYIIQDVNRRINFNVIKDYTSLFHEDFLIRDDKNNIIVTIRKKIFTAHERWQVYRNWSISPKDLLFSVMKPHLSKVDLDVFLKSNTIEDVCDFKIKESWFSEKTFDIYMGDNIIAQIQKKHTFESIVFGKDKFMLYVNSYVDHVFIVALTVIANEIGRLEEPKTLPSVIRSHILKPPTKILSRLFDIPINLKCFITGRFGKVL